jgi:predicted NACHT family NTPase
MLLLFDGLDEVTRVEERRRELVSEIVDLTKKYPNNQVCVTCRTAADDYTFEQFTYVEIADFDEGQQVQFARKWYEGTQNKFDVFLEEWGRPRNRGLRDLATTPLLLALLCLAFDETLQFPLRRVDLYREAIDALLRRWDSSRNIFRDAPYKQLSASRKEQLLSRLAAETFQEKRYAFRPSGVERVVLQFIASLPAPETHADVHVESVLRSIEAQHGLIVERARGIFSFSHLSFHEYFMAAYIVENNDTRTIDGLLRAQRVSDPRWREVVLLTASLLHSAEYFFERFVRSQRDFVNSRAPLRDFLQSVNLLSSQPEFANEQEVLQRIESTADEKRSRPLRDIVAVIRGHKGKFEDAGLRRAYALLSIVEGSSNVRLPMNSAGFGLNEFIRMSHLMAECLRVASVSDRRAIEIRLLSPT